MKDETLEKKWNEIIRNKQPKTLKHEGKSVYVSQKMLGNLKTEQEKSGGFLPLLALLPLIFGGLAATGGIATGVASAVKTAQEKTAADKAQQEAERHNQAMEKVAKGEAIKDFGSSFAKETRKIVKDGLLSLADKIKIEKQGDGLFLSPYNKSAP